MDPHTLSAKLAKLTHKVDWWHSWPGLRLIMAGFIVFFVASLVSLSFTSVVTAIATSLSVVPLVVIGSRIIYLTHAAKLIQRRLAALPA